MCTYTIRNFPLRFAISFRDLQYSLTEFLIDEYLRTIRQLCNFTVPSYVQLWRDRRNSLLGLSKTNSAKWQVETHEINAQRKSETNFFLGLSLHGRKLKIPGDKKH